MLAERTLVAIVILPLAALAILAGGWVFALTVALILSIAAWEFWRMVRSGGFQPSVVVMVGGVAVMALLRFLFDFPGSQLGATVMILLTMAVCTRGYELSRNQS